MSLPGAFIEGCLYEEGILVWAVVVRYDELATVLITSLFVKLSLDVWDYLMDKLKINSPWKKLMTNNPLLARRTKLHKPEEKAEPA